MSDLSDDDVDSYLKGATPEELEFFKSLLREKNLTSLNKLKTSLYRVNPPTPIEFLDNWISKGIRQGLYPFVVDTFCKIWDFENKIGELILYGATRTGKTLLSRLCILYIVVILWCMKNPHKYFHINPMSSLSIFFLCFSKKKTQGVLLKPFYQLLITSPKFHQVDKVSKLPVEQDRWGADKIVWTRASLSEAEIEFSNNILIQLGSNPMDIIGADIIAAIISEINFFIETVGVTEEDVWRVYTETKDRITGTVGRKYGSLVIIDSSANNRESIIESYILGDASKDPNAYILNLARWEAQPHNFPEWQSTGKTFEVFVGSAGRRPSIVDESFLKYPGDERLIINVPIDSYMDFKNNIVVSLKNIAGVPSGATSIFFPEIETIKSIFDPLLVNVTTPIITPLHQPSHGLILNQIKPLFFEQDVRGKWVIKRARNAARWIHVDLSEASDRTGIAMVHPEIKDDGTIMMVYDFAFDIQPDRHGINLDSLLSFVRELYLEMSLHVVAVSTDKYQSGFFKQGIMKDEKEYKLISTSTTKTPYQVFKSKVMNGSVKCGYYVNLFNNLKCLIETKDKIDHSVNVNAKTKGRDEDKSIGLYANDISDSCASSLFSALQDLHSVAVSDNYDDITRRIKTMREVKEGIELNDFDKKESLKNIMGFIHRDAKANLKKVGT